MSLSGIIVHEHSCYTGMVDKYWYYPEDKVQEAIDLYKELYDGYMKSSDLDTVLDLNDGEQFRPVIGYSYRIEDDVVLTISWTMDR